MQRSSWSLVSARFMETFPRAAGAISTTRCSTARWITHQPVNQLNHIVQGNAASSEKMSSTAEELSNHIMEVSGICGFDLKDFACDA